MAYTIVNESELKRQGWNLETAPVMKRTRKTPKVAFVVQFRNGSYQTWIPQGTIEPVIDVISWDMDGQDIEGTLDGLTKFFGNGYPTGRKPVAVRLGQ